MCWRILTSGMTTRFACSSRWRTLARGNGNRPRRCSPSLPLLSPVVITTPSIISFPLPLRVYQAAAAGEGSHPSSNIGLNRWFGVLRHLALPPDADAAAASLSLHLVDLEKVRSCLVPHSNPVTHPFWQALEAILASVSKYAELNTQLSGLLQEITVCVVCNVCTCAQVLDIMQCLHASYTHTHVFLSSELGW